MAFAAFAMVSCNEEPVQTEAPAEFAPAMTRAIRGDYPVTNLHVNKVQAGIISSSTTWGPGNVWELAGVVRVPSGVTLTIQPGTVIIGSDNKPSCLVVSKGGKLIAEGTATNPIIFTSNRMVDGKANTGKDAPEPGDFGGVVLLGNAVINQGSAFIEGLPETPEFSYGGNNNADNSGSLQYVRIEYAGYQLAPNVEINGLTCGGVGSGTTLSHIQVSWGLDDSFEFFGGCVDADHLISYAHDDDGFDFDFGYTGTIEYGLDLANPASTHAGIVNGVGTTDSNGIELDNDAAGSSLTPITRPTLRNVTIIGTATTDSGYFNGMRIRRNGQIAMENCQITGYPVAQRFDLPSLESNCSFTNCEFSEDGDTFGMLTPFYYYGGMDVIMDYLGAINGAFDEFAEGTEWALDWTFFPAK